MGKDEVIQVLEDQVACYRRLAKLTELQHVHVQQEQPDALMDVLTARQSMVDRIMQLEQQLAPVRRDWNGFIGGIAQDLRDRARALMAETLSLVEQITIADQNDALVLQQRKLNVGKQIHQARAARKV